MMNPSTLTPAALDQPRWPVLLDDIDADGQLSVWDALTGRCYVRPHEAEGKIRALEEELARLRQINPRP